MAPLLEILLQGSASVFEGARHAPVSISANRMSVDTSSMKRPANPASRLLLISPGNAEACLKKRGFNADPRLHHLERFIFHRNFDPEICEQMVLRVLSIC